jgi:hypothetical protein
MAHKEQKIEVVVAAAERKCGCVRLDIRRVVLNGGVLSFQDDGLNRCK